MNVRRAGSGDEARLRTLRLEALTDSPDAFSSSYEREVAYTDEQWQGWLGSGATFFAEDGDGDGEQAGLVSVYVDGTVVRLVSMWLRPAARGTGAADALMGAALAWAGEQNGCRAVRLCVMEGNVAARRVYERHGFALTGECRAGVRDGLTQLDMERPLSG